MRVYQFRHPGWVQGREVSEPARQPSTVAACNPGSTSLRARGCDPSDALAGRASGQNGGVSRADPDAPVMVAQNRRARHEYLILEEIEAGLVLKGTEVKSLRAGRCSLAESHVRARSGELFLVGAHIPEYSHGGSNNHASGSSWLTGGRSTAWTAARGRRA